MIQVLVRILLALATISTFVILLTGIGVVINRLVIWDWLTNFFIILQRLMYVFNFMWDVDTTISVIAWLMVIDISYWVFLAGLIIIRRFNKV